MTAKLIPLEINNFVGGLVTDANPLSFPDKASLDEQNMVVKPDGTRERRLGIDVEGGYAIRDATAISDITTNISYNTFKWENVSGIPNITFSVIQIGNHIAIYDLGKQPISAQGLVYSEDLTVTQDTRVSFTSVDGTLVVATGSKELFYYTYDAVTEVITKGSYRLLIRDLFGVDDILDGIDYREGSNISKRPKRLTDNHIYNLRNQTFGNPRLGGGWFGAYTEINVDCIKFFNSYIRSIGGNSYPSNADSVLDALYPDTESKIDPLTDRFHPKDISSNISGNLPAPIGFFIIDALDRGASRLTEINKLHAERGSLSGSIKPKTLKTDSSPGGARVVTEFAGRVFYAGFTSEVVDGDGHSPRMSSYVLFSKLIESPSDLKVCYQVGDPTSKDFSEVLDTDGGFVRIEGAHGIISMVPTAQGLCILARNGVWLLSGEDRGQFKATSYSTSKLSSHGCDCPNTIIDSGDGLWYWSSEGVFQISANQFGDLQVINKSTGFIQRFFDDISDVDKVTAVGVMDTYDRCLRWVYGNNISSESESRELVFDLDFECFYPNKFMKPVDETFPVVLAPFVVPPFRNIKEDASIVVGVDEVIIDNPDTTYVVGTVKTTVDNLKEVMYLVATGASGNTISYTFGSIRNTDFEDWGYLFEEAGGGIDAEAYLLTGWLSGGDFQRFKQVPYLTTHFYKTEDGFEYGEDGDLVPLHRSSCKVQTQWNWSNHINSGKWGGEFQAYRISRRYFPVDVNDEFDNGFYTVVTRNKLRGSGKVLSLLFKSEPKKAMRIIGWSLMVGVANGV